jgi:hypothetical protein
MAPQEEKEVAQFENNHLEVKEPETPLPSPVTATVTKPKPKLSTTVIIPVWIALSSSVIIYNNYLYNTLDFKYPVFLVTFHLTFAVSSLSRIKNVILTVCRLSERAFSKGRQTCWMEPKRCTCRKTCSCVQFFPLAFSSVVALFSATRLIFT